MAKFISPSRRRSRENAPVYSPFGSAKSRNVLKDYRGSQSEEVKVNLFLEEASQLLVVMLFLK
jgi:hypothetical protein